MMDMGKNDEKTCREFADWIASRHAPDARLDDFEIPDQLERNNKAVDARFRVGNERYVIEHTTIQSFEGQRYEDAGFTRVVWPLEGILLSSSFTLITQGTANQYSRVKDIQGCQQKIREWIDHVAPMLGPGDKSDATIRGVSFPVTLWKDLHSVHPTLKVGRWSADPENRECERAKVVSKALNDKLSKLLQAASDEGACSVLLLEGADPAQAGPWLIAASVANELGSHKCKPDLIYLIETHLDPHYLTALKHGPQVYSEPRFSGPITLKEDWPLLPL